MPSTERIVRRFLATQIADPKTELGIFLAHLAKFSAYEHRVKEDLPLLKALADTQRNNPLDTAKAKELSDRLKPDDRERREIKWEIKLGSWFKRFQLTAQRLFWSLLQQYSIPSGLQKSVETASKFWSKSGVRAPKEPHAILDSEAAIIYAETYVKVLSTLREQASLAEAVISKGHLHSDPDVDAPTRIHVGQFTVVNTGGFDAATMKRMADIVEKADKALVGHKLGKICYGDILISKQVDRKKNILAFYLGRSDEMFIRADATDDLETVLTVAHELAHRFVAKFLAGRARELRTLYNTIDAANRASAPKEDPPFPHIGDMVPYKGEMLKVIGYGSLLKSVKLSLPDEPKSTFSAPVETVARLMGWRPEPVVKTDMSFITAYAKSGGPEENFAEMVSYYVLNLLPKPQVELLEPILFQ